MILSLLIGVYWGLATYYVAITRPRRTFVNILISFLLGPFILPLVIYCMAEEKKLLRAEREKFYIHFDKYIHDTPQYILDRWLYEFIHERNRITGKD